MVHKISGQLGFADVWLGINNSSIGSKKLGFGPIDGVRCLMQPS
jgi:hypothetical protein